MLVIIIYLQMRKLELLELKNLVLFGEGQYNTTARFQSLGLSQPGALPLESKALLSLWRGPPTYLPQACHCWGQALYLLLQERWQPDATGTLSRQFSICSRMRCDIKARFLISSWEIKPCSECEVIQKTQCG